MRAYLWIAEITSKRMFINVEWHNTNGTTGALIHNFRKDYTVDVVKGEGRIINLLSAKPFSSRKGLAKYEKNNIFF